MNLFIDFSNEKDHPSIHDRYLSGRYSQTYPSRKQDTPEFFFPGTGIRTEERDSVYIQICILLRWETPKDHEAASIEVFTCKKLLMTKKKLPVRFTGQHFTIDKVLIKMQ